ncbi:suppressor of fused domain protein [Corynebacterium uberis]|uniref:suppressor of fused domain protein n=2 Tax=Corynebacterium TaxID=1716 RepID=UPI001D0AC6BB|nr:suppressor of fused domain protein [Corynebacterium uberis]UDL73176.1 suppressor of fused domain protein [Corynebacterium uberis]UDL75947.1 suppressor of fused domain protein [Corynebacterium uberis]UDL78159.1 suppressor of fused domain protein [Corynebacterium uberis]UDL80442.1 suppressor of fused domain protein [Corynebacterium uberis]UDL82577.1 suppressor of fused domain protein [Corynebacterium uberis]
MPAQLDVFPGGAFHVGVSQFDGQSIACTTDFARIDTGLQVDGAAELTDVRSELFVVAEADVFPAVMAVGTAADVLRQNAQVIPAEPGTMLPGLAAKAGLLTDQYGFATDVTVRHGLLVPPFMWGGPVPQFAEAAGDVHGEGVTPGAGRLTVMLQLILLTDAERAWVLDEGMAPLLAQVEAELLPVHDWRR